MTPTVERRGKELREAVAQFVFKWTKTPYQHSLGEVGGWKPPGVLRPATFPAQQLPPFESDIEFAWQVVTRMFKLYPRWEDAPEPWRKLGAASYLFKLDGPAAATEICLAAVASIEADQ